MTVKYLVTLKMLGVDGIGDYFICDNYNHFHPALDSYVLDAIGVDKKWSTIPDYDEYDEIRKKLSFTEEYRNWPLYAYKAGLKKNGEKRTPEKGTYKRYVYDNDGYSFLSSVSK